MNLYKIIDRLAMFLALLSSGLFFSMGVYETSIAMLMLWPATRAAISIIDVFFTFFTERPLIRVYMNSDQGMAD
ncbi:MAG: hypothetical protein WBH14_14840 [Albidovulum sp.]